MSRLFWLVLHSMTHRFIDLRKPLRHDKAVTHEGVEGWQRMRWLDSMADLMGLNLSKLLETVEDRGAWHAAVHGGTKAVDMT